MTLEDTGVAAGKAGVSDNKRTEIPLQAEVMGVQDVKIDFQNSTVEIVAVVSIISAGVAKRPRMRLKGMLTEWSVI